MEFFRCEDEDKYLLFYNFDMSLSSKIFCLLKLIVETFKHALFIFITFFCRPLLNMLMQYFWNITSVASFCMVWAPSAYGQPLGSKGCQHKKNPLKEGMCCASGPKYRNSVCFGVDKKECESL